MLENELMRFLKTKIGKRQQSLFTESRTRLMREPSHSDDLIFAKTVSTLLHSKCLSQTGLDEIGCNNSTPQLPI